MTSRLVFVLAIGIAGCIGDGHCTLLDCYSGLRVTVTNGPAEPYRIEVRSGGSFARYRYPCSGGPCTADFPEFFPRLEFPVYVVTASDTTFWSVRPNFVVSQPNGVGCDPECLIATVTLTR